MEGAARRIRRERNTVAWGVWHTEALARSKKLPKMKTLLVGDGKPARRQTWQEQYAIAMQWEALISKGKPNV